MPNANAIDQTARRAQLDDPDHPGRRPGHGLLGKSGIVPATHLLTEHGCMLFQVLGESGFQVATQNVALRLTRQIDWQIVAFKEKPEHVGGTPRFDVLADRSELGERTMARVSDAESGRHGVANTPGEALLTRHAPALDKRITNEGHLRWSV